MSLRLILFIVAMIAIAWIVFDHQQKNKKRNYYKSNKKPDARSYGFIRSERHEKLAKHDAVDDIDDEAYDDDYLVVENSQNGNAIKNNPYHLDNDYYINNESEELDFDHDITILENELEDEKETVPTRRHSFTQNNTSYNQSNSDKSKDNLPNIQPVIHNTNRVFTVFIKAKDNVIFNGDELLQVLLSLGCRYGNMNIFHRHEQTSGHGKILFSIASMVKPGTFDINNMQAMKIPGIALFFTSADTDSPLAVFDLMMKTSYRLAKHLNAELLDQNREPLTAATTTELREYLESIEIQES